MPKVVFLRVLATGTLERPGEKPQHKVTLEVSAAQVRDLREAEAGEQLSIRLSAPAPAKKPAGP